LSVAHPFIYAIVNENITVPACRKRVMMRFFALSSKCLQDWGVSTPTSIIDAHVSYDVLLHLQKDLRRIGKPDPFKIGGYLCFWVRKLKPFKSIQPLGLFTNETMALSLGLAVVGAVKDPKNIPRPIWDNMIYDLRYRPVSPSTIVNQFYLLYV